MLFLLQPSYPKGTCFTPWRYRGAGFPESHPKLLPLLSCPHLAWQLLQVDSAASICLIPDLRCPLESAVPNPACSNSSFNKNVNLPVSHELGDKEDWAGPGLLIIILSCDSPRVQASVRPKSEPSWQPGAYHFRNLH